MQNILETLDHLNITISIVEALMYSVRGSVEDHRVSQALQTLCEQVLERLSTTNIQLNQEIKPDKETQPVIQGEPQPKTEVVYNLECLVPLGLNNKYFKVTSENREEVWDYLRMNFKGIGLSRNNMFRVFISHEEFDERTSTYVGSYETLPEAVFAQTVATKLLLRNNIGVRMSKGSAKKQEEVNDFVARTWVVEQELANDKTQEPTQGPVQEPTQGSVQEPVQSLSSGATQATYQPLASSPPTSTLPKETNDISGKLVSFNKQAKTIVKHVSPY